MNERQWKWLSDELGLTEEQREDAEERFERLGTIRGVVVEYLRMTLNQRLMGVTTLNVPGAISLSFAGSIEALERWLARVEAGPEDPSDPDAEDGLSNVSVVTTATLAPSPVHTRRARRAWRHPDSW